MNSLKSARFEPANRYQGILGAHIVGISECAGLRQSVAQKLAKGEIASLSGAGDDARYFQISVPVQPGMLESKLQLVRAAGDTLKRGLQLSARAARAASPDASGENVNYAVKSPDLSRLGFLESVPEVSAKLKEPKTKERKFEEVVKAAEQAAVLVLVY